MKDFEVSWYDPTTGKRHSVNIESCSYKGAVELACYSYPNICANNFIVRGPSQFREFLVWQGNIYLKQITSNSETISTIRERGNVLLVKPSGRPTRYHFMVKLAKGDEYLFLLKKRETHQNVGRLVDFSLKPYEHLVALPIPENIDDDERSISNYPLIEWAIQNKIPWSISVKGNSVYVGFKHKEDAMEALLKA